jgi:hypothetical protein
MSYVTTAKMLEALWDGDRIAAKRILESMHTISDSQKHIFLREAIVGQSTDCIGLLSDWIVPDMKDLITAIFTENASVIQYVASVGNYGKGKGVGLESEVLNMFTYHTIRDEPYVLRAILDGWDMNVTDAMIDTAKENNYSNCTEYLRHVQKSEMYST